MPSVYAQPLVPPIGNKDGTVRVLGGLKIDSAIQLPYWDMAKKYKNKGIDTTGVIAISLTDSLPKYLKKGIWYNMSIDPISGGFVPYIDTVNHQKIYSSYQIDTFRRRVNRRLPLLDSIFAVSDTFYTLPAGAMLDAIVFIPTITQTLQVGTTFGGSEILYPMEMISGIRTTLDTEKEISGTPQTLYISGVTGPVNIRIRALQ